MSHIARISCHLDSSTRKVCSTFPALKLPKTVFTSSANGACYICVAYEGEAEETLDKTYYVFLPPELCLVHPLPGSLVRGAQRLPSIMRRVESMLLAIQLKDIIKYPVPALKVFSISGVWIKYCN